MAWSKNIVYASTFYTMYTMFLLQAIDMASTGNQTPDNVTTMYMVCIQCQSIRTHPRNRLAKVPPEDGRVGAYGLASVSDSV